MKKIRIEVGSNRGTHTDGLLEENVMLYCFEPSQELYYELWNKYKNTQNVMILPFAIDTTSDIKKFNVQGAYDWGCSSLNEYNDSLDQRWPNRVTNEFIFTHSYNVFTIRLDQFCSMYNITEIDYLWIDAQGHDLKVLQSLGNLLYKVRAGQCEASGTCELYKNTGNTFINIKEYLETFNFSVNGNPDLYETDVGFINKNI